jgi:hypothetical protein
VRGGHEVKPYWILGLAAVTARYRQLTTFTASQARSYPKKAWSAWPYSPTRVGSSAARLSSGSEANVLRKLSLMP